MPVLGITGGIASGKSSFVPGLLGLLPGARLFDADAAARDLLQHDRQVREHLQATFGLLLGPNVDPLAERAALREIVFSDPARRRQLEAILHPRIRERWLSQAQAHRGRGGWFCVDIPLLFETGAESYFDQIIVVACSAATQMARLRTQRGLEEAMAQKIIATQLDLRLKMNQADHLIWNDSTIPTMEAQTVLLAGWLSARYG